MRLVALLLLLSASGCLCVVAPDRQYACEPGDLDCQALLDAGAPDAGVPDAGVPDAGAPDAGTDPGDAAVPGCDGGLCRFDDGGYCPDWACVDALWVASSQGPASTGFRPTDLPPGVDGGQYGWFGGVLLPDGRVLAVAHTADRFLTFDPRTQVVQTFGPLVPGTERKYAGGVLAPNGKVYVFPYQARFIVELTPEDGGWREVGTALTSLDGGDPLYVGGVVDRYGTVWTGSESSDGLPLVRFDPGSGTSTTFRPGGPWGGWWGMARLPDDRLLVFPKEFPGNPSVLSPYLMAITPGAAQAAASFEVLDFDVSAVGGGFPLQGGSLTREGAVCATPSGLESRVACVRAGAMGALRTDVYSGPVTGYGFNASFGDGRVWTTPDLSNRVARIASDGGITITTVASGRYGYLGYVATPQGLVAIPGAPGNGFLQLQPGMPGPGEVYDSRPLPVLLSPYFNKL